MKFEGIIYPMISPFTVDRKVYVDSVRDLVDFLVRNRLMGFFICGTYSLCPVMMYSVSNIPATYAVLKLRGMNVGCPKPPHKSLFSNELQKLK